jgi:hypothetical protein
VTSRITSDGNDTRFCDITSCITSEVNNTQFLDYTSYHTSQTSVTSDHVAHEEILWRHTILLLHEIPWRQTKLLLTKFRDVKLYYPLTNFRDVIPYHTSYNFATSHQLLRHPDVSPRTRLLRHLSPWRQWLEHTYFGWSSYDRTWFSGPDNQEILNLNFNLPRGWDLAEWSERCACIPKITGSNSSGSRELTFRSDLLLTARCERSTWVLIDFACPPCYPGNTLFSQRLEPPGRAG